ncbi:copper chaperone PCu(A)C [Necropsobacter massiliensis]|uniref:copper chaperone PCu(A)C n=1 Tax=Necropsobacter massiliensis TaxID=1400001 RepID=UPI00059631FC|nr:copper chaperone PCu(A)C [Necropsobacter massiliensis]
MKFFTKTLLILTALLPLSAFADIIAEQPVVFATAKAGEPSAVFMRLTNTADQPVNLALAESALPSRLELHGMQNGKMLTLAGIEIPPHSSVELKRGGLHIMVFDSAQALTPDSEFPLTLFFDNGETLPLRAKVIAH